MKKSPGELLAKFISGQRLTDEEYILLDKLLNDWHYHREIHHWLEENWQNSSPEAVNLKFEQIRKKIRISSIGSKTKRLITLFSKAAAVLFIPLLAVAIYFYTHPTQNSEMLTLSTQKGEHTSIILPDGSKVWLNVDTKLSYPVNYGAGSRQLKLEGEAYFEVTKNDEMPFIVSSGQLSTTALGTQFVVTAYTDSPQIKSSLLEGNTEVRYCNIKKTLNPGQQLIINKKESTYAIHPFEAAYELAWKNDELVFRLMPFGEVVTALEKWYDINIDYDPDSFKSETLTVRFEKYETLEQVLEVMGKANGFSYSVEGKNVILSKIR